MTVLASVSEHGVAKPAPSPEAPAAYKKSSGESGGVIAMIDLLIKDLDKETGGTNVIQKFYRHPKSWTLPPPSSNCISTYITMCESTQTNI